MKYLVRIGGREIPVEVLGSAVTVGGRLLAVTLQRVPGTPVYQLLSPERSRWYVLLREGDDWLVQRRGRWWRAEVWDEAAVRLRAAGAVAGERRAEGLVRAPMPGLVLRVEVAVGQRVEAGTGLVVLEAMKMENEIRSPGPGRVRAILVEAGRAVEKGAPLVELGWDG